MRAGHPQQGGDSETGGHLAALLRLATQLGRANELADVLETAAVLTRDALGASTASISRWEAEAGLLRTLINVGDLSNDEEHWPQDEVYPLDDYPTAVAVLRRGEAHVTSVDQDGDDLAERTLLARLGKTSSAAVPIVTEGAVWGELYATRGVGRAAFGEEDVTFMQAICAQVALALARAELFGELMVAAYRDPLTGLGNRRAFDERLDTALLGDQDVVVLLGDVDDLKALNDSSGHDAGDRALRAVARSLSAVLPPQGMAARIGGDEFCALLEGVPLDAIDPLLARFDAHLTQTGCPTVVSWGIASTRDTARDAASLLRAADAQQYRAKGHPAATEGRRRRFRETPDERLATVLQDGLDAIRGAGPVPADRARALTGVVERVFRGCARIEGSAGSDEAERGDVVRVHAHGAGREWVLRLRGGGVRSRGVAAALEVLLWYAVGADEAR